MQARAVIEEAMVRATEVVMKYFPRSYLVQSKSGPTDLVTEADLASQEVIIDTIKKAFPHHGIVAEEESFGTVSTNRPAWFIDPLDGTLNFVRRIPLFGMSVALVENARVTLAAISLPFTVELFIAERGKGASINGQRISSPRSNDLQNTTGIVPSRASGRKGVFLSALRRYQREMNISALSVGSTAVAAAYVIDGRADWIASFDNRPWDYAAASLILSEAGCKVTDERGNRWTPDTDSLVAAPEAIHQDLIDIIAEGRTGIPKPR